MIMKLIKVVLLFLLLPTLVDAADFRQLLAGAASPEEQGLVVAREVKRRDMGFQDTRAEMRMVLIDPRGGEAVRDMHSQVLEGAADSGDKSILTFESPADIADTALLTYTELQDTDQQWLYLPALKRAKRIASKNRSGPFLGSEFAYEDLASFVVDKYGYRYIGENEVDGFDCYVIIPASSHRSTCRSFE
jgi:hypothetical protein